MDANLQATFLAYKAYKIGRESVLRDRVPDDACFVRDCLSELESRPSTEEVVRRRLFYTLILAELHRRNDPVPFRESAMHLGEKLEQLGLPNPFPMFMNIIRATTRPPSTGNFGDITTIMDWSPRSRTSNPRSTIMDWSPRSRTSNPRSRSPAVIPRHLDSG